jgi:hypothetical protein
MSLPASVPERRHVLVSGDNWPAGAQAVISAAGIARPTPATQALSG